MNFAQRAVESCRRDWENGMVVESHVRDVLKSVRPDVSTLEPFIRKPCSSEVRVAAARILAENGKAALVVEEISTETERDVVLQFLGCLTSSKVGLESLSSMLASDDKMIRDDVVDVLRRAGMTEDLFPLLFDDNDLTASRIRRYMNEKE